MELSKQRAGAVEANAGVTPEPLIAPEPPTAEELNRERNRSRLKKLGAPLIALVALASKGKFLFLALIKIKAVTTLGTMFISIVAYALAFGWPFAVGFVLLLFVHEMGHVIQLRREGVEASAPVFIPFVGALIAAESLGKDAAAEARVGMAGPILGTAATLVPLAIWLATGSDLWRALAYVGFFINLINLLPVLPLDGGRAMAVLGPYVWIAGLLIAVAATSFPAWAVHAPVRPRVRWGRALPPLQKSALRGEPRFSLGADEDQSRRCRRLSEPHRPARRRRR